MTSLMSVNNKSLSIISPEVAAKVAKKNISPSLITSLKQCPAKWAADSFVLRDLLPQEDDNPASRGSLYHKIMEVVFEKPAEERTRELINAVGKEVMETEEFQVFKNNQDADEWLTRAVDGYYRMGGRPEKVQIASYRKAGEEEDRLGLEVFVKGQIGDSSRETLGYVDRLTCDQKVEGGVIVEDWKTGAKAKVWNPKTKSEDGKPEARQQIIYSMLLKKEGVNVTGARLIYPVAGQMVPVDINDQKFNDQVVQDVEDTDASLTGMIEANEFPFRPNVLCSWCPMLSICPVAQRASFPKARDAARKQPGIEVLAPAFEFN